jgi:hypothetical protein
VNLLAGVQQHALTGRGVGVIDVVMLLHEAEEAHQFLAR